MELWTLCGFGRWVTESVTIGDLMLPISVPRLWMTAVDQTWTSRRWLGTACGLLTLYTLGPRSTALGHTTCPPPVDESEQEKREFSTESTTAMTTTEYLFEERKNQSSRWGKVGLRNLV